MGGARRDSGGLGGLGGRFCWYVIDCALGRCVGVCAGGCLVGRGGLWWRGKGV